MTILLCAALHRFMRFLPSNEEEDIFAGEEKRGSKATQADKQKKKEGEALSVCGAFIVI